MAAREGFRIGQKRSYRSRFSYIVTEQFLQETKYYF